MNRSTRHFAIIAVLILVVTASMFFVISDWVLPRPFAASAEAGQIETMFRGHFVLMGLLFAIIVVPMLYAVIVFRQKPGDESDAPHIHGNTTLEIVWTIVPVLMVVAFAIWGVVLYTDLVSAQSGEYTIRAQGFKWDWGFYYPDQDNKFSESLVLEVGKPVALDMQSRDVIHAFWVPEFRVKQDILPFNTAISALGFNDPAYDQTAADLNYFPQQIRFTPTEEGVYRLRCAEICGTSHWAMLANVFVLSSENYQKWVAGEYPLPADPSFVNGAPGSDGYYLNELQQFCQENGIPAERCLADY